MKTLRQQYQDLDNQIIIEYIVLINKIETFSFFIENEDEDFDELSDCEMVTIITSNGDNLDVRVLEVTSEDGIYVAEDNNESNRFWINLSDLSSLYDKITIVELLQEIQ